MKYEAKVWKEMPDTKDKYEWKEAVCKFTETAFELYSEDYENVAKHIHGTLEGNYGVKRWVVFVYELPGDSIVWYQDGYCCTLECLSGAKKYYVAIKCYPNEGFVLRKIFADTENSPISSPIILEKGNVDEKAVLSCFAHLLLPTTPSLSACAIQDALGKNGENYGIGTDWGVCKCKKGAIACNLSLYQYILFQFGELSYFCFRQF